MQMRLFLLLTTLLMASPSFAGWLPDGWFNSTNKAEELNKKAEDEKQRKDESRFGDSDNYAGTANDFNDSFSSFTAPSVATPSAPAPSQADLDYQKRVKQINSYFEPPAPGSKPANYECPVGLSSSSPYRTAQDINKAIGGGIKEPQRKQASEEPAESGPVDGDFMQSIAKAGKEVIQCPMKGGELSRSYCIGATDGKSYRSSTYDCGKGVRLALQKVGVLPKGEYLAGYAKESGPKLKKIGFHNLCGDTTSSNAPACKLNPASKEVPVGAVLVYKPAMIRGRNGQMTSCGHPAGHIEIKAGNSAFTSDYYSSHPRTGNGPVSSCRILIGVYVK